MSEQQFVLTSKQVSELLETVSTIRMAVEHLATLVTSVPDLAVYVEIIQRNMENALSQLRRLEADVYDKQIQQMHA